MKKLNKLQINSEKLMKNEELTTLRGGYGGHCCWCFNSSGGYAMAAGSSSDCMAFCQSAGMAWYWDVVDPACI